MRRRKILKSVGAASGIGIVGASSVQARSKDPSDVDVETYEENSKIEQVLREAKQEIGFKQVLQEAKGRNWTPDWSGARCGKTSTQSGSYKWAVIELHNQFEDRKDAFLSWIGDNTTKNSLQTNAAIQIFEKAKESEVNSDLNYTFFGYSGSTSIYKPNEDENGGQVNHSSSTREVVVKENDFSEQIKSETGDQKFTSAASDSNCCVVDACVWNNSLSDIGCVIQTITSFTGVITGCTSCAMGNPLGCVGCIAGLGGLTYLINHGCLPDHGCTDAKVSLNENFYEDHDTSCSEYEPSNDKRILLNDWDDVGEINDSYGGCF
ncbi:hypothetical protein [Natrinema longum]|uniref:Uncharacterized protein n=1 Tax=Natrinema longum TaxID=370324 RepID=A0A8A2UA33_9EURY|nr:hypothetical protein [Natrinema longum]MBZ6496567.1 hypothetical protein [Natrinema longum]QSW85530.1 hypothetical protein J0X27_01410 [Natrinema longum]